MNGSFEKRPTSCRNPEPRAPKLLEQKNEKVLPGGPTPDSFIKNSKITEKRLKSLEKLYVQALFQYFVCF